MQQGNPLGPFLFALGIQDLISNCKSDSTYWYLDDSTIAGNVDTVLRDAKMITSVFSSHDLNVNQSKSELFLVNPLANLCKKVPESFNVIMPGIKLIPNSDLSFLGAPMYVNAVEKVIEDKIENLKLMTERLKKIEDHDALFLLRNCLSCQN